MIILSVIDPITTIKPVMNPDASFAVDVRRLQDTDTSEPISGCTRRNSARMRNDSPPLQLRGHVTPTRTRPVDHVQRLQSDPRAKPAEKLRIITRLQTCL